MGVHDYVEYSPYKYVEHDISGIPPSPNLVSEDTKLKEDDLVQSNYISLAAACKAVIKALEEELGKA